MMGIVHDTLMERQYTFTNAKLTHGHTSFPLFG